MLSTFAHSGIFIRDPERKRGRILRQIQFVRGTTDAGGAQNILLWSFECPIHACGVELHFNVLFSYRQKYSGPLPYSTTRQIFSVLSSKALKLLSKIKFFNLLILLCFFTSEDRKQIFCFRMNFVEMRLDRVRQAACDLRIIKPA